MVVGVDVNGVRSYFVGYCEGGEVLELFCFCKVGVEEFVGNVIGEGAG